MTNEEIFEKCVEIYHLPTDSEKTEKLYPLLQDLKDKNIEDYPFVLNHLIRELGLYPYMSGENIIFEDRLARECFTEDVGEKQPRVLHREQARILHKLLKGENLAVSAPTSFGKSFVIDALIAIKKPKNILIIVPTLSLMDEMRRRITRKFGDKYRIITQTEEKIQKKQKHILIFPAERANQYLNDLSDEGLDLFVLDEFYKITNHANNSDKRVYILQNAVHKIKKIAKQTYFLCPNVSEIAESKKTNFLEGMETIILNFKTVALNVFDYSDIDTNNKLQSLQKILEECKNDKNLIYFKSKNELKKQYEELGASSNNKEDQTLKSFGKWIGHHYSDTWDFCQYISLGFGQHHADLHRFIQQMQIKLYEEIPNFNNMLTTTSLIEGVNTSAKNVILWDNYVARSKMKSFTYKNIIGRGGRMFRYFVGNIYLLAKKPNEEHEKMEIEAEDEFLYRKEQGEWQTEKQKGAETILKEKYGSDKLALIKEKISNYEILMSIEDISTLTDYEDFIECVNTLKYMNGDIQDFQKAQILYYKRFSSIIKNGTQGLDKTYLTDIIKSFSQNYKKSIYKIANELNIDIYTYCALEKNLVYEGSKFLNDFNTLQKILFPEKNIDISPCVTKMSHAFLPKNIFYLEEWGLPRMVSKKIHQSGVINLEDDNIPFEDIITKFKTEIDKAPLINTLKNKGIFFDFDDRFIEHFYEGLGF